MRWVVGLAALLASAWALQGALHRLADLRRQEAALAVAAVPPRLAMPPGAAIVAPDRTAADNELARRLGDAASIEGVRLGSGTAAVPIAGLAARAIVAEGAETAVRRFARRLEEGRPVVRLIVDRAAAGPAGVTLRAQAVAPWRPA